MTKGWHCWEQSEVLAGPCRECMRSYLLVQFNQLIFCFERRPHVAQGSIELAM